LPEDDGKKRNDDAEMALDKETLRKLVLQMMAAPNYPCATLQG